MQGTGTGLLAGLMSDLEYHSELMFQSLVDIRASSYAACLRICGAILLVTKMAIAAGPTQR
jgi:hypothetical protein